MGDVKIAVNFSDIVDLERRWNESGLLKLGGVYRSDKCRSRHKIAIVIPFRNREAQLPIFLNHMHPLLQRQQIDYGIFVVEQTNSKIYGQYIIHNGDYESNNIFRHKKVACLLIVAC